MNDNNLTQNNIFATGKLYGAGILLLLLVIITYSGATKNNFVSWDDNEYVIDNKLVRSGGESNIGEIFSTVVSLNYHPLTILSLRLNDNNCRNCPDKISAKPFITTNILLHAINTILVFALIYLLFSGDLILAFIVAALFAVHPMHVESVAWVSARKDVLSSFFFLSGLISWYMYHKYGNRKYLWTLLSLILFIFACLSKATSVVFPVILILINYLINIEEDDKRVNSAMVDIFSFRAMLPLLPFFAVSIFFGLMAVKTQSGENFLGMMKFIKEPNAVVDIVAPFTLLQRFQIACYGFFVYLVKFVIPVNQSAFYPYPALSEINQGVFSVLLWVSLLAFVSTIFLVVLSMRKTRLFIFTIGFYLVTLALVLHFVSVGKAIVAERYTYLPYIGLSIIPAYYISQSTGRLRRWLLFLSGSFIITMLLLARKQVDVWNNAGTLWSQAAENHPDQELAWRARGKYYYGLAARTSGQNERKVYEDKALADFRMAIKQKTKSPDVYEGMGVILQSRKEFKTALGLLNIAVRLNPENGRSYYNRAIIFDQMNQKEEAIKDYESALSKSPEMTLAILRNRSALYLETGNYKKALNDLNELISIDSREFIHYCNRAFTRVMLKDYDGAIADYQAALKLNPGDKQTIEQLRVLTDNKRNK